MVSTSASKFAGRGFDSGRWPRQTTIRALLMQANIIQGVSECTLKVYYSLL